MQGTEGFMDNQCEHCKKQFSDLEPYGMAGNIPGDRNEIYRFHILNGGIANSCFVKAFAKFKVPKGFGLALPLDESTISKKAKEEAISKLKRFIDKVYKE
jgi:hypothetical protein